MDKYDVIDMNQLRKQTFPEYYNTLDGFSEALDANEDYNNGRPGHVPIGNTFRGHKTTMKELGVGADRGDTFLIDQRQSVRDLSELDVDSSVSYMKTIAIHKKEPTMLYNLSLPLKDFHQKTYRKGPLPQSVDIHVDLKHLKGVTGGIVVMGKHVRNGGPYLLHLCKGRPLSEDSWYNPGGHHNSCRRIELRDLEPANEYWVRMMVDRPDGQGKWSQPVSIIVL